VRRRWPVPPRTIVLKPREIDVLDQFVTRIEAVDPARPQEFAARVRVLVRFVHDLLGDGVGHANR
jgi:hypothetical protein